MNCQLVSGDDNNQYLICKFEKLFDNDEKQVKSGKKLQKKKASYQRGVGSSVSLVPDDVEGVMPITLEENWITHLRYTNENLFWDKPKGLRYRNFAGHTPVQIANLYPDGGATYFLSYFTIQQGWSLTLNGQFPHARYMSITISKPLDQGAGYGGGQFIRGDQIVPDRGSINPFLPGVNRHQGNRNYTVNILQQNPPAVIAPNTLYIDNSFIGKVIRLVLRVYLPDKGYDGSGVVKLTESGSGLPAVTLNVPATATAPAQTYTEPALISVLNIQKGVANNTFPLTPWKTAINASSDPVSAPASLSYQPEVFYNLQYNVLGSFYQNDPVKRVTMFPPNTSGGFANNPDTQYLSVPFSFSFGEVFVIKGKMPTFPSTRNGDSFLQQNPNVQYFSITTGAGPVSGVGYNCINDEMIPVDSDGNYTVVISWPQNRPKNATLDHGYVWLSPGSGEGEYVSGRVWFGVVYIRFMAPDSNWAQSPANIPIPTASNPAPSYQSIMGPYYPTVSYMSKSNFETTH